MAISRYNTQALFAAVSVAFIAVGSYAVYSDQYLLLAAPFAFLLFYIAWQYRVASFYLLLASLPFSFEYNFTAQLGTDIPDEFLMLLVSVLFFGYWLYKPQAIDRKKWQHPLMILLIVLLGWGLITVLFSTDPTISVKYLLAKSWYVGAFVVAPLIFWQDKKVMRLSAIVLSTAMVIVTAIALIRHAGTGFHFATVNKAVNPFFRNHVNYSALLVCTIPLLVAGFYSAKKKNMRLLLGAVIATALLALFFSYARGAWLALLAGAVAYWLMRKRLLFYGLLTAVIITTGLLFWIKSGDRYLRYAHDYKTTIFHEDFSEHLVSTYQLKDVSTAERFYRWIAGVRMIKDNWLTGYGPNTFYYNYKPYAVPAYKTWVSDNKEHSTVHNYFLLMAIEQGVPGLLFFLLLIGGMAWYAQHLYNRITDPFYKPLTAVCGVVLVMILVLNFLSDLVETDKIGSIFFLCFSLLIVTDSNTRKNGSQLSADV